MSEHIYSHVIVYLKFSFIVKGQNPDEALGRDFIWEANDLALGKRADICTDWRRGNSGG